MSGKPWTGPDRTEDRFWPKVRKGPGCWEWLASRTKHGYGQFKAYGKMVKAHRYAYALANGPIPDGLLIDHKCMNRACVNPDHLRLATEAENSENLALHKTGTVSGVRGVCWSRKANCWMAYASKNRRRYHAGLYSTIEEAAAAARAKRNELYTFNETDRDTSRELVHALKDLVTIANKEAQK